MKSFDGFHGIAWALCTCIVVGHSASAADRIILRSLDVISDRTVTSFDEDGVQLDDKSVLGWHDIDGGRVAADKQAAFDKLVKELGQPLYRIRQRLGVGDYRGTLEPAESVYPRYLQRTSDTAYMVCQAMMWARLANGERERAVEPYLRCYEIMRARRSTSLPLPGSRRLPFDPKTGLARSLAPVWFDRDAAKSVMPDVFKTIGAMRKPRPPAAYLYYATLALAAGDDRTASGVLRAVQPSQPAIVELRAIIAAQREVVANKPAAAVAQLADGLDKMTIDNQALAMYWLGRARLASRDSEQQREGMLMLVKVAALHGKSQPELAAAGLLESMQSLEDMNDLASSVAVRAELLGEYATTYAARSLTDTDSEADN